MLRRRRLLDRLLGEVRPGRALIRAQRIGVRPGQLTPEQKRLAEKFRRGIADVLGIPPEAIREDVVERWVVEWSKAFVKPEYWAQAGITW